MVRPTRGGKQDYGPATGGAPGPPRKMRGAGEVNHAVCPRGVRRGSGADKMASVDHEAALLSAVEILQVMTEGKVAARVGPE